MPEKNKNENFKFTHIFIFENQQISSRPISPKHLQIIPSLLNINLKLSHSKRRPRLPRSSQTLHSFNITDSSNSAYAGRVNLLNLVQYGPPKKYASFTFSGIKGLVMGAKRGEKSLLSVTLLFRQYLWCRVNICHKFSARNEKRPKTVTAAHKEILSSPSAASVRWTLYL